MVERAHGRSGAHRYRLRGSVSSQAGMGPPETRTARGANARAIADDAGPIHHGARQREGCCAARLGARKARPLPRSRGRRRRGFRPIATYDRARPAGRRISRWYCREGGRTFTCSRAASSSRLRCLLREVEDAVAATAVEGALQPSNEARASRCACTCHVAGFRQPEPVGRVRLPNPSPRVESARASRLYINVSNGFHPQETNSRSRGARRIPV